MGIKLYIDSVKFNNKPDSLDIKKLSRRILKFHSNVSITELANSLEEGCSVVLAEYPNYVNNLNKFEPIIGQQVFMLDFDNKDSDNLFKITDLKNDKFIQENASFYYKTFSDESSSSDKFRVVFVMDSPVKSIEGVESIYNKLFEMYPQSDKTVGQTSRIFFGGTKVHKIKYTNRLNLIPDYGDSLEIIKTEKAKIELLDSKTPNYILFKYRKFDIISKKLGDKYSVNLPDEISALNYFKRLDLVDILELPNTNPFLDILHDESEPSASVYQHINDVYLYTCFSNSNKITKDIFGILFELNGDGKITQIENLIKATNSNMNQNSELGIIKRDTHIFTEELLSHEFQNKYPDLYKWLKPYIPEINIILKIMLDYSWQDSKTGDLKYLNYLSKESLAKEASTRLGYKVTTNKIWTALQTLVVVDAIMKLKDSQLPPHLLNQLKRSQKNNKNLRRGNVYELYNLSESSIMNMEEIAKILVENKVTIRGLSYELIYRLFNEEKANRDFPQAYDGLIKTKKIKMSKENNNLTTKSLNIEKTIIKYIFKELENNNYVIAKNIHTEISKKHRLNIASSKLQFSKIIPSILDTYDLQVTTANKKIILDKNLEIKPSAHHIITRK